MAFEFDKMHRLTPAIREPDVRSERKYVYVFYLVPEFTMLAFTSALEVLRLANQSLGRDVYEWQFVSLDGRPVRASCGLSVDVGFSLAQVRRESENWQDLRMAIICTGRNVQHNSDRGLASWLRELRRRRIAIGAVCTGAHLLASAGILQGKQCTIHWENLPGFAEQFPDVHPTSQIFEVDDGIYTCAGGIASLEMMLHIVAEDVGNEISGEICQQALVTFMRDRSDRQRLPFARPQGVQNTNLRDAIRLMERNIAEPLPIEAIAEGIRMSRRQTERLFRQEFGCGPARYYIRLRLEHANSLLRQTAMPIVEVAVACGFVSSSHFSKTYRSHQGFAPNEMRKGRRHQCAQVERLAAA
ncbi:GlxA family transcriptional regulator (plasmid) [Rhizobium sp. CB3171]|uniref:GlxA family transcriptional regulator n=1 Tax=Rhizobium sp. CB3171 TaxID=3039157 RepID=UPI0024B2601D|nr:GlxA family transcriptional regulator [Rhizobium sp. CB3171]WFU05771.1 GlxA family transcriptional regulator [Rhizobium sp. CB3171]